MTTPCDQNSNCPGCDKLVVSKRDNQPGLPVISYRLGTHGEFFQRMLDSLHTEEILRKQLTTRNRDDFAVAILDAWAVIGDVLSFYQERIANEGFLRTAVERRSILEIARTLGYELNPGVAAGTYLAFSVDSTNPAYAVSAIPAGTQAQSIPAPGERPQTFETSNDFEAHVEWNEIKPRQSIPQVLAIKGSKGGDRLYIIYPCDENDPSKVSLDDYYVITPCFSPAQKEYYKAEEINHIFLKGIANNLKPADILLFVGEYDSSIKYSIKPIVRLEINKEIDRTDVYFDTKPPSQDSTRLPRFALKDSPLSPSIAIGLEFNQETIEANILDTVISEQTLQALIQVNKWDSSDLAKHVVSIQTEAGTLSSERGVFAFREHLGFFGNNAPQWNSLPISQRYAHYNDAVTNAPLAGEPVYGLTWDYNGWVIWNYYSATNSNTYLSAYGVDVFLERPVEGIAPESWTVFLNMGTYWAYRVNSTTNQSLTGFSLSGKATGLKLKAVGGSTTGLSDMKVRNTTAFVKSEALALMNLPVTEYLKETTKDDQGNSVITGVSYLMLDGFISGLHIGQPVIINGERVDAPGITCHEVAVLYNIVHVRGYTILYFKANLQYQYLRDTVIINANVVSATHGETINEFLGSGAGTSTNQDFVLKKPPLTYVSAATPSGSESTLAVKVNNIKWEPAGSLYNLGPQSRSYIVRLTNEGKVHIKFGDGKQGARLPTGQENITATYRSGIGPEGEVAAESIKLIKTRPAGIKNVTNPVPASGSQSPETMDAARQNAPLTVLTMDRIVSLQDYEDYSRAFAGIGKAQAIVLWNGENELVHITIASASGETIESSSDTYKHLCASIDTYRDLLAIVQVDSFDLQLFQLEAKLLIDKKYTASLVLSEATTAIQKAFAFASRDFGQPVTSAEVISILQRIPGVTAVDLDKLYLTAAAYADCATFGPTQKYPPSVLPCSKAKWLLDKPFQKSQLLLVNPVGITLKEIQS